MTASDVIRRANLQPHPEGGWYRETVRRASGAVGRDAMTAILFLLDRGERSRWHRVDADELWLWHAGAPLALWTAPPDGRFSHRLGPNILDGHEPQVLIPAGQWQSAEAAEGWALVSCVVVPGFDFAGFEMMPDDREPPA